MSAEIHASDEEWAALLAPPSDPPSPSAIEPSEELERVSRKLAEPYLRSVGGFAAAAFRGSPLGEELGAVRAAIRSLTRLAVASGRLQEVALLESFPEDGFGLVQLRQGKRRLAALSRLRDWLGRLAEVQHAGGREELLDALSWKSGAVVHFAELGRVPGVGPRRLERLYLAGLYSVRTLAAADPDDVAAVTGMPRSVATSVIERTRSYARAEQERTLDALQVQIQRLKYLSEVAPLDGAESSLSSVDELLLVVNRMVGRSHELH